MRRDKEMSTAFSYECRFDSVEDLVNILQVLPKPAFVTSGGSDRGDFLHGALITTVKHDDGSTTTGVKLS